MLAVDGVLQPLAGREARTLGRLDLDWRPGARIAAFARGAFDYTEIPKPHDLDFAALFQRCGDGVEGRIDRCGRRGLRHLRLVGHRSDELVLGHRTDPFLIESTARLPLWARRFCRNYCNCNDSFSENPGKLTNRRGLRVAKAYAVWVLACRPRSTAPYAGNAGRAAIAGACERNRGDSSPLNR